MTTLALSSADLTALPTDALVVAIRSKAVGDSVELGIERGGQKQQVTMVLKADTQ